MDTFVRDHSGQSTSVWELAPMELPIGSLGILVKYLTNPTFRIRRAGEIGENLCEEKLNPQPGPHMSITQPPYATSLTRGDRWTRVNPISTFPLSASRDPSRDSSRRSVIIFSSRYPTYAQSIIGFTSNDEYFSSITSIIPNPW